MSTNAYTSRSQGTAVTKHSILVHCNVAQITKFLNFVACKNGIKREIALMETNTWSH